VFKAREVRRRCRLELMIRGLWKLYLVSKGLHKVGVYWAYLLVIGSQDET
jgi:hypothetical protein